jgi:putative endonuclease
VYQVKAANRAAISEGCISFSLPRWGFKKSGEKALSRFVAGTKSKVCAKAKSRSDKATPTGLKSIILMQKKCHRAKAKPSRKKWFVYVVRCRDQSLYTGITTDLERRLRQHNSGTASRYTRSRLPVKLVYEESSENQSSALKRELAIKAMTRREKLEMVRLNGLSSNSQRKRLAS